MDPRIQSVLIILITLAIGFGAGFVASGIIVRNQYQSMRKIVEDKESFFKHLSEESGANAEQMEEIRPILEQYHREMRHSQREMFQKMRRKSENLREELAPYLTEEQIEKVVRGMRMRPPGKRGKWKQGPGPRPRD